MDTIVITGAGTGIGAATAAELAKDQNLSLVLLGRRIQPLEDVLSKLPNRDNHIAFSCDVSNQESIRNTFAEADFKSRNVTGLFANAGIGGENQYGDGDRWNEIIAVNLTGAYNIVMESLPHLIESKAEYTNVVVTSSVLARFGVPNHTAYCASKTGLLGLVKALATQHAKEGVLVNAICPGWVETEMAQAGIQNLADRQNITYEEAYTQQMGYVPTGKMSEPEEVARLVRFLLSNQQTSITGQALDINNGAFMI